MARTKHTYQIPSVSFTKEQQRNAIQSMACRKWHKEIAANICEALCIAMRIRGGGAKCRIAEGSDDHVHLHDAMEICEMFQSRLSRFINRRLPVDLEFCLLESSPEDPKEGDMKLCLDTLERSYDVFLLRSTQKNTMTVGARECINSIRETLRQCRDVLLFLIQDSM